MRLTFLGQFGRPTAVDELADEGDLSLFAGLRHAFVVWVLLEIVRLVIEQGQALEIQNAPAIRHVGKLARSHQFPVQRLIFLDAIFRLLRVY